MNICIVNENLKMGGVQRVTAEIAKSLHENGNNVKIIDFSGKDDMFFDISKQIYDPKVINPRNIKRKITGKLIQFKSLILKRHLSVYEQYKEQTNELISYLKNNNFDILIMNEGKLTSLIPIINKEMPKIKTVAWQHNEYDIYINHYNKKILNDYYSGIKQANLVVCLTEADQKKFSGLNVNTTYIYNPLTIDNEGNNIADINNKIIIFVGRLKLEQKGLDYLLELSKNLRVGWKILVAGDGPDKDTLITTIKKNNLSDRIILKGSLSGTELVKFYLSGSIFISTSRWEGFGLVITEAMLFGLPIISFENSGPSEILKNGRYGILVEKNNITEFSEKLNELIDNHNLREMYQNNSLTRVKDFSKEAIIKSWENEMKKILHL